ncbi:heme lyase CcmF/NrfE family subunit [Halocynthiibacter namhaensis]|uniref:heme lyase CcmF/NrfE family subunit n=1 Tax=Halocynthiibacter namhaensis TaxID=1290553 RepID=UPI0005791747|nr:heme lyase CcmF/NrfE family subunit [Halocynthiibacter namhaensis]
MYIELGHLALILALPVALVQMILPMIGAQRNDAVLMRVGAPAAMMQFLLVLIAFFALTWGFIVSDFSLKLVTVNSHSAKPMLYKISGVWGNHEGSVLLWVLILALFGAAAAVFGQDLPMRLKSRVLSVQAAVGVAFLCFILFTSNPFIRLEFPPLNGQGLNPLLQDPGLAFHPPFLYLGYVGLSMAFSFAVAALLEGRVDAAWARWVRPWTLAAWVFLTIGIALGSWWAYYELGWGGFWFWDPVENASFMPWLVATALLHSAIVVEKRETLKSWTILLAILAFGFSLMGTFIVRSGVLTSVHAFANDPERGLFILVILGVFMGGALTLFAARAHVMESKGIFALVSRESGLVLNNVLLVIAAFVVFVGTIWPLVSELAFDRPLSVGAPFFNTAFTPFILGLSLFLPIGALFSWKRARLGRVVKTLALAGLVAVSGAILLWAMQTERSAMGPVGLFMGLWIGCGTVTELWQRSGGKFRRLIRLPGADWGKFVSHSGFGIVIFGIAGLMAWEVEDIRIAQIGESFDVGGFDITLEAVDEIQGPNYFATQGIMRVKRDGQEIAVLHPERRRYPVAGMPTTEAGIANGIARDIYLVIGDAQVGGGYTVRSHIKPFANWIWGGAIFMALGGFFSLFDRRLRVAAGRRSGAAGKMTAVAGE